MAHSNSLHDKDFVAWSKQQADMLRAASRGGSNHQLDGENLAEEMEDLGNSQRSALGSYLMRIIQHLTKLEYSPTVEPRNGWRRTIRLARRQAQKRVDGSPSLRLELARLVEEETKRGIEYAIADLEEHGEIDEVEANVLQQARYTEEQVLGDWFPEEPRG
jgi:Domain of unknown function DUF29